MGEPEPFVPHFMVVNLKQITKREYEDMSKSPAVTARRPIGFVYESATTRLLFVNEDNKYYQGKLDPSYTKEMFESRQTTGVDTVTKIVFTRVN